MKRILICLFLSTSVFAGEHTEPKLDVDTIIKIAEEYAHNEKGITLDEYKLAHISYDYLSYRSKKMVGGQLVIKYLSNLSREGKMLSK